MSNGLTMAEYMRKYGVTPSSFYYWLKKGRIGRCGHTSWGTDKVSIYVDKPPIMSDVSGYAKYTENGEATDLLSVEELRSFVVSRSNGALKGILHEFAQAHPDKVEYFGYFESGDFPILGLPVSSLADFYEFSGLSVSSSSLSSEDMHVRVSADVLGKIYPYNFVAFSLYGKGEVNEEELLSVNIKVVLDLLDLLPESKRRVIESHFLKGLTYKGISETLGVTREAVRQVAVNVFDSFASVKHLFIGSNDILGRVRYSGKSFIIEEVE